VTRIDRGAVLAKLHARDVIAHYQITGKATGNEFRTRVCPGCGARRRDSVVINLDTGRWYDASGRCSGGLLALVAGLSGLGGTGDDEGLLDLANEIAMKRGNR